MLRVGLVLAVAAVAVWAFRNAFIDEHPHPNGVLRASRESIISETPDEEISFIAKFDTLSDRSPLDSETKQLTVSVQSAPDSLFEPLAQGWVHLSFGERSLKVEVTRGLASFAASSPEFKELAVDAVVSDDGQSLWFDPDEMPSGSEINCYAFPGFFAKSLLGSGVRLEGWSFGSESEVDCHDLLSADPALGEPIDSGSKDTLFVSMDEAIDCYLLRVSGRAWTRIRADDLEPGATVYLSKELAGSVSFLVHPNPEGDSWLVVSSSLGATILLAEASAASLRVLDGWPVGAYEAYLSAARDHGRHLALSDVVAFSVDAGSRTNVVLTVQEDATVSKSTGSLRGVLAFEAWDLVAPWYEKFGLSVQIRATNKAAMRASSALSARERMIPTGRMEVLSGPETGNPAWAWQREALPVGQYELVIEPIGVSTKFEIIADTITVLDEPVADLAVIMLSFNRPVDLAALSPMLLPKDNEPRVPGPMNASALLRKDADVALMMASAGAYTLGVFWGSRTISRDVDLHAGWNEVSVDMPVDRSVTLRFVDEEGNPMPWERRTWDAITFTSTDGEKLDAILKHVRRGDFRGYCSAILDLPADGLVLVDIDPLSEIALEEPTCRPLLGETTDVVVVQHE